jgi:hypothetical protein
VSTTDVVGSLVRLQIEIQHRGVDAVVSEVRARLVEEPIETRRKIGLFLGGLRMHFIGVKQLVEQPYGFVGACEHCGMLLKIPRAPGGDCGEGACGRALDFRCPSAPKKLREVVVDVRETDDKDSPIVVSERVGRL